VRQLALAKQSVDLHTSTHGQWLFDGFVRSGHFKVHLDRIRPAYAEHLGVMEESLRRSMPPGFTWMRPSGGFYCWCRLPEGVAMNALVVAAGQRRVSFLPGTACSAGDGGRRFVRFNFTFPSLKQIREGVRRFAEALRSVSGHGDEEHEVHGTRPIV
jgi:DNA-binding transcriptional MocR family regulator